MRNIYQEKRIDRLKRQGIKLEARSNHMHNMPINNPQPNRFLYRGHDPA